LLDAAEVIEHGSDEHWFGKQEVETEACYFDANIKDICDPSQTVEILDGTAEDRSRILYPFAITASDTCSTLGITASDREARVRRQLMAITPKAVERELWNGALSQAAGHGTSGENENRWLTNDDVTDGSTLVTSAGVSAKRAVSLLEGALANCGAGTRGMIHMPRTVASLADTFLQVEEVGTDEGTKQRLVTKLGTVISAGVGYTGTDPGDDAPATNRLWIYATGLVTVHLGPISVLGESRGQMVDISDNTMKTHAERGAAVVWDGCCHFAAEVDITAT
jgi:hypothetical protein